MPPVLEKEDDIERVFSENVRASEYSIHTDTQHTTDKNANMLKRPASSLDEEEEGEGQQQPVGHSATAHAAPPSQESNVAKWREWSAERRRQYQ